MVFCECVGEFVEFCVCDVVVWQCDVGCLGFCVVVECVVQYVVGFFCEFVECCDFVVEY